MSEQSRTSVGHASRTAIDACAKCGGSLTAERWTSESSPMRETTEDGIRLRTVIGVPEWAAPYALQGETLATRYTCSKCGHVAAILARDA